MSDILSTSVSGLLAFQRALDVTSNNIANVDTPGYSVERPNFAEAPAQSTSSGFFGNGVDISSVTRSYDELLAQQVRSSQASYSSLNAFATQAAKIDNMLSDSSTGLTASLQGFVNALQNVADSPSASAQRQALLAQAQSLAQQLNSYSAQITQYGSDIETQIGNDVSQVNSLATSIATLNAQIASEQAATGQSPNQLLDQRDQLIGELSQYVGVSTAAQSDGTMNVYIGSGQALVVGGTAQQLKAIPNTYDASQYDIGLVGGAGTAADVTSQITGGELGGLLSVRSQVLDTAQNTLGQLSVGLATVVNQQQESGMDLTGAPGQAFFSVGGVQVLPSTANADGSSLTVTRANLAALTTDDYQLSYTGGSWQLTDTTTGQSVPITQGTGTSADPFVVAGLSIVVNGAGSGGSVANGDSFLIRPTATAAASLSVSLTSPSQIAAASLVQAAPGSGNTGAATVSSASVTNPDAWTGDTYAITFTSPAQYSITDTTTGQPVQLGTDGSGNPVYTANYTSGSPIGFDGEQVTLSGTPAASDTFTVSPNDAANTGDNSNALAMIDALSSSSVLDGGTASLTGAANGLVSQIGVVTQQAQAGAAAQQTVNQDATTALSNISGVNLDEEAANMVKYQQAYQAMAEMIQASGQMFSSLISAITNG